MDNAIGSCCMRMILMCLFKDLLRKPLPLCSFYSEKLFLLDLNSAIWVFPSLGLMGLVGLVKKKKKLLIVQICAVNNFLHLSFLSVFCLGDHLRNWV